MLPMLYVCMHIHVWVLPVLYCMCVYVHACVGVWIDYVGSWVAMHVCIKFFGIQSEKYYDYNYVCMITYDVTLAICR